MIDSLQGEFSNVDVTELTIGETYLFHCSYINEILTLYLYKDHFIFCVDQDGYKDITPYKAGTLNDYIDKIGAW